MPSSPSMAMMTMNEQTPSKAPREAPLDCRLYLVTPARHAWAVRPPLRQPWAVATRAPGPLSPAFLEPLLPCGRLER